LRTNEQSKLDNIDSGLKKILADIEKALNADLYFTSIMRSEEENQAVNGWSKSQHVDWDKDGDSQAVDIRRSSFKGSPEDFAQLAYSLGATGVGIYDKHIHIDNNPNRLDNPYFKDYRTKFTKYDESKKKIGSFDFFKDSYNKALAFLRQGKTDNSISNDTGLSDEMIFKIGLGVVGVLFAIGLLKD